MLSEEYGKSKFKIFFDIVICYLRFSIWSNQYTKEKLCTLSSREKKKVCIGYKQKNQIRDDWYKEFMRNRKFFSKWSQKKYESDYLCRRDRRKKAYAKKFNAGENFELEYDVEISRQHYLPGTIKMGRNVLLAKHVFIDYSGNIDIGDNVKITDGVHIITHDHVSQHVDLKGNARDCIKQSNLKICDDAFIGTRATILPSCHYIGKGATISAGSVVVRNVPDGAFVAGNPAKNYFL